MRFPVAAVKSGFVARNTVLLYGFSAARAALFLLPVLVPYLNDHVGLSFHEALLTEAAFAAVVVAGEVPSGWLADRWQRKNVLVLGSVFWLAGLICVWVADGFAAVVAGQMIMGVAASMQSGADSALLYDTLLAAGARARYLTVESRRHGIALAALATSSALAGPIYVADPNLVFAFGIVTFALSGLFASFLREPPRRRGEHSPFDIAAMFAVVWRECRVNPVVYWAVLFAGALLAATKVSVWLQQAYLLALNVELVWFGPIAALGFVFGGLTSQLGPALNRSIGPTAMLTAVLVAVICGYAIGGLYPMPITIPVLFVGIAAYGLLDPALKTLINDRVASDRRATILSVLGLAPQLTFVGLSHVTGQFVDRHGAADGYSFLALFVAVAAGAACLGLRRHMGRM